MEEKFIFYWKSLLYSDKTYFKLMVLIKSGKNIFKDNILENLFPTTSDILSKSKTLSVLRFKA